MFLFLSFQAGNGVMVISDYLRDCVGSVKLEPWSPELAAVFSRRGYEVVREGEARFLGRVGFDLSGLSDLEGVADFVECGFRGWGWDFGLVPGDGVVAFKDAFRGVAFQVRHASGAVLNVGCSLDIAGFRSRGAVNVDLNAVDPVCGVLPVDVVDDARVLAHFGDCSFDSVVLGDILEHMCDVDACATIRAAVRVLKSGGRVVITVPFDKAEDVPHRGTFVPGEYTPGIPSFHYRDLTPEIVDSWLGEFVGVSCAEEVWVDSIFYGFAMGVGVVLFKL